MNKTLTGRFLINIVGNDSAKWLLNLDSAETYVLAYWVITFSFLAAMLNTIVLILCVIIYLKTSKTNHKPAFVFIGLLSFFDAFLGFIYFFESLEHGGYSRPLKENWRLEKKSSMCQIESSTINWFMLGGIIHTLLFLTIDRFIFINRPLHYPLIMTRCRAWMMFLVGFVLSVMWSVLADLSFQLPAEDPDGLICSVLHDHHSWWIISISMFILLVFATIIGIYSNMLYKFRQSRKRLEALQQTTDEDYTKSRLTFHQTRGFSKKHFVSTPGSCEVPIQTLSITNLENGQQIISHEDTNYQRKRRSSSVVKRAAVLVSHAKAAFYVLLIVTTHLACFLPSFSYILYDNIKHELQDDKYKEYPKTNVDSTVLLDCLKSAVQNRECNMTVGFEEEFLPEVEEYIASMFHITSSEAFVDLIHIPIGVINSVANPIFYALWYSDFRDYVLQIPSWFKRVKQLPSPSTTGFDLPPMVTVKF